MNNSPLKTSRENGCYILNINCENSSEEHWHKAVCAVKDFVKKHKRGKCAINLEKAQGINHELLEILRTSNLSIFGASSEVLGYMSLTNTINLVPVYRSKNDFLNDKRKFIKRSFRVVKQLCQPLLLYAPFLKYLSMLT